MSFSAQVKSELCRIFPARTCCVLAECFGILLYCNTFHGDLVRIVTESRELCDLLPRLFRKAFSLSFDEMPESQGTKHSFVMTDPEKLRTILEAYGFSREDTIALHVNLSVLEEDCCKSAFLRGAFLAGGSVTDPAKGYHLELATSHSFVSRETSPLIQEMLGAYPKQAKRGGSDVLYFKQSDLIADFLTLLGAPISAMGIIEAKLEKRLKNKSTADVTATMPIPPRLWTLRRSSWRRSGACRKPGSWSPCRINCFRRLRPGRRILRAI